MRALLDTHTFLWWNLDDLHLSIRAREVIADGKNEIFLSAASAWEIAIKAYKGKLTLPERFLNTTCPNAWHATIFYRCLSN